MMRRSPLADHPDILAFARDAAAIIGLEFGVSPEMIFSASRWSPVANARHFLAFLLREHAHPLSITIRIARQIDTAKLPFTAIGKIIGGRDHTTIMASVRLVAGRLGDPRFAADRELAARIAAQLDARGYGPFDLKSFFPGPPASERQAGVSKAIAVAKRSRDRKREAVPADGAVNAVRSYQPAKHGDSGVSVSSEKGCA